MRFFNVIALLLLILSSSLLQGQTRTDLANLMQDVQSLNAEVGRLRLSLELVSKENQELRNNLNVVINAQNELSRTYQEVLAGTETRIQELRSELMKADRRNKEEVVSSVSRQLENFAADMNKSLETVAKSTAQAVAPTASAPASAPGQRPSYSAPSKKQPANTVKQSFSSDFPKSGVEYTIQRGDNLWRIATKLNSKVDWIQNANRISDPSKLNVGQLLFIPQK